MKGRTVSVEDTLRNSRKVEEKVAFSIGSNHKKEDAKRSHPERKAGRYAGWFSQK